MPIEIEYLTPLIQVFNMPRSLAFYRDLLGFGVVRDSGGGDDSSWVLIQLNGCRLMLNDQYEPGHVPDAQPPDRTKWHQDTILYFGADPDAACAYLISKGLSPKPPIDTSYGMRQLSLRDPDGYGLCFQRSIETE
jgi:glyoxylase I family protein